MRDPSSNEDNENKVLIIRRKKKKIERFSIKLNVDVQYARRTAHEKRSNCDLFCSTYFLVAMKTMHAFTIVK